MLNSVKICIKCGEEKDINLFQVAKQRGKEYIKSSCIICEKDRIKQYKDSKRDTINKNQKEWREKNKEKVKNWRKESYFKNKEYELSFHKEYVNNNKDKIYEYNKKYRADNKDTLNSKRSIRFKIDNIYRLSITIRNSIRASYIKNGYAKNSKTEDILGISYNEFKIFIESKLETWMNWDNYGKFNGELNYGWDIDHIIPLSSANNEEDMIKLNHYTNLQPLDSKINRLIKKDIINYKNFN